MKAYYKVMPGTKSMYADRCRNEGFIGVHYGMHLDLSDKFREDWKVFNEFFIPEYIQRHPEKSKIAAGLAGGTTWVICYKANEGDLILSPDGNGKYMVGEIASDYYYVPDDILPHRRKVNWFSGSLEKSEMSEALQKSINSAGTYTTLTDYGEEIESLIGNETPAVLRSMHEDVEDPTVFGLEKHLEDFLVSNWGYTELGKLYDIYEEEGEICGQQFPSDTGPIDILAVSKDKSELVVIELKKGRASDRVVGQIQRYMGYVKEVLAEENQTVRGIIIALEDSTKIRRALSVTSNIEFYRYQVSFKLNKVL